MTRTLTFLALSFSGLSPAWGQTSGVCNNLLADGPAGRRLFRRYEKALRHALATKMHQLGWKGKKHVSVQNLWDAEHRVFPKYMIRVDLSTGGTLKNKTTQSPLKLDSYPYPETRQCLLVLSSFGSEYLVNEKDVPTAVYIPELQAKVAVSVPDLDVPGPMPLENMKAKPDSTEAEDFAPKD